MVVAILTVVVPAAFADEGWSSYTDAVAVGPVGLPADFVNTPAAAVRVEQQANVDTSSVSSTDDPAPADPVAGPKGDKGDPGATGATGSAGPQGEKGDNADLCQNLPGVQTTPGLKYNAQRYWRFLPKWEKRYLAVNRKRQIVCVTLRWIHRHAHR